MRRAWIDRGAADQETIRRLEFAEGWNQSRRNGWRGPAAGGRGGDRAHWHGWGVCPCCALYHHQASADAPEECTLLSTPRCSRHAVSWQAGGYPQSALV